MLMPSQFVVGQNTSLLQPFFKNIARFTQFYIALRNCWFAYAEERISRRYCNLYQRRALCMKPITLHTCFLLPLRNYVSCMQPNHFAYKFLITLSYLLCYRIKTKSKLFVATHMLQLRSRNWFLLPRARKLSSPVQEFMLSAHDQLNPHTWFMLFRARPLVKY